jgi:anti-sigma B factor antagonist
MEIFMTPIKPCISIDYTDTATVITFTDDKILEEKDIQSLQESIMSVLSQSEQIQLILDFSNVKFLSSSALGLLIRVSKKIYENNGELRLCGINPKIYEVFKITRLTKIFDIYPDAAAAEASLSGKK